MSVSAIHFDHGLHDDSPNWAKHCADVCTALAVPLETVSLDLDERTGESIEARAREARYRAAAQRTGPQEALLTAHHANDQAETVLLHLLRSSGLEGLAGIPAQRPLGDGWLLRPLLSMERKALQQYLQRHGLTCLEDPSNVDLALDRNYLRHEVLPLLEHRWPHSARRLEASARYCRGATEWLHELVLDHLGLDQPAPQVLPLSATEPGSGRFALAIRAWLRALGAPIMPASRLAQLARQLREMKPGARLRIDWGDWVLHEYRDSLYAQPAQALEPCPVATWDSPGPLLLGPVAGVLEFENCTTLPEGNINVRPMLPGDRMDRAAAGQLKVKELLRNAGIPHWLRPSVPIIERNGKVISIGGVRNAPELNGWLEQRNAQLTWSPAEPVLASLVGHRPARG
ncbi:MAG: tRNA lysidine(34) synthetase TilS, partial [Xanthomonadales bacterium]|nr:tRNA lysidine(34) synthetase TilS [Xanthomonadales bacterium]